MSTLSQNTIQTEALKAPAPQVGQSTGPVGFKSGLSVSTTAILALIEALMKISDLKNDLFSEQVTAETKMAQAYSQGQEQIGEQEMFDYIGQAVSGFVSGALNLGMGLKGMFEESKLQPLQEKINGATSYQKLINDRTPAEQIVCEVPEQEDIELQNQAPLVRNEENEDMVQNRFKEMLSKEEFTTGEGENTKAVEATKGRSEENSELTDEEVISLLNDNEIGQLRDAYKEKLDKYNREFQSKQSELRQKFEQRQLFGQSATSFTTSGSNMNTAVQKQLQGSQNAENTLEQSSQQIFGQTANETQKQSDQDYNQVIDLTQVIVAIDNTNRMNNG